MSDFDIVVEKLGSFTKANILHFLKVIDNDETKEEYKQYIVDSYYNDDFDHEGLFWPKAYDKFIKDIHLRMSYRRHNRVIRNGVKCKACKSTNTFSFEQQRAAGDEYIPTKTICYDCRKQF